MQVQRKALHQRGPFLFFKDALSVLADFVYPPSCVLCKKDLDHHQTFCDACQSILISSADPIIQSDPSDFRNLSDSLYLDGIVSAWPFTDEMEKIIHLMKYQYRPGLCKMMGHLLGEIVKPVLGNAEEFAVVPIPLHPVRKRERGYNQSEKLSRGLAEELACPIHPGILKRIRYTDTQTALNAEERQKNVSDVFQVRPKKLGEIKHILLLDDVITTGATMNQCAKKLRECGAEKIIGVSLSRPR